MQTCRAGSLSSRRASLPRDSGPRAALGQGASASRGFEPGWSLAQRCPSCERCWSADSLLSVLVTVGAQALEPGDAAGLGRQVKWWREPDWNRAHSGPHRLSCSTTWWETNCSSLARPGREGCARSSASQSLPGRVWTSPKSLRKLGCRESIPALAL